MKLLQATFYLRNKDSITIEGTSVLQIFFELQTRFPEGIKFEFVGFSGETHDERLAYVKRFYNIAKKVWYMIQTHSEKILETISCPFPISMTNIKWPSVTSVISLDDKKRSVIVEMEGQRYLVEIPAILYDSIYKSCEKSFMEEDLGFDEMC
jgi:hypothetical protein